MIFNRWSLTETEKIDCSTDQDVSSVLCPPSSVLCFSLWCLGNSSSSEVKKPRGLRWLWFSCGVCFCSSRDGVPGVHVSADRTCSLIKLTTGRRSLSAHAAKTLTCLHCWGTFVRSLLTRCLTRCRQMSRLWTVCRCVSVWPASVVRLHLALLKQS